MGGRPVVGELACGALLRRGSGGTGRWTGGNGVVRKVRFLEPMTAAILSNRRRVPPQGAGGGEAAAAGRNSVERADGSVETLATQRRTATRKGRCGCS